LKEMNGKYIGNRPIKLRKSTWKNRIDFEALEKGKLNPEKENSRTKYLIQIRSSQISHLKKSIGAQVSKEGAFW